MLTYCEQKVCRFWWVVKVPTGQAMALQSTGTWSTPPYRSHSSLQWKTRSHSRDLETSPQELTPTNRPELWRDTVRGDLIGRYETHSDKLIHDTNCVQSSCNCLRDSFVHTIKSTFLIFYIHRSTVKVHYWSSHKQQQPFTRTPNFNRKWRVYTCMHRHIPKACLQENVLTGVF